MDMKTLTLLLLSVFTALAQIETTEYRFVITQPEVQSKLPFISALPWVPDMKPSVLVVASPKEGVLVAKEHRITLRWEGKDGKIYRQTRTGTYNGNSIFVSFDVDVVKVLSVDVERINPPVIQEAK